MESEATFGSTKETCQLHGMGDVPLTFPIDGGTDRWNAKVENVFSKDHDRTTDSSRKEDQSGHLYRLTCRNGDSESFSFGSPSKSSVSEGITKDSDAEDSMQKGEAETFIVSTHPIQEFSARCVLNLFLDSLDIENNKSVARKEVCFTEFSSICIRAAVSYHLLCFLSKKSSCFNGLGFRVYAEDSMQKGEAETFIVSTHPIQEFSARCVLNLFLDSLDIENNKSVARKEIPSRKSVSENSADSSAESESNEDAQARNASYSDAINENVKQQPAESREMGERKNAVVDRNSSTIQTQCTHKNQDSKNNDSQVIATLFTKHEHVKSGNESVTTQIQYDEGESSFSASSLIAFSGSISYSGSLSLRSNCSATSARSFAFPM